MISFKSHTYKTSSITFDYHQVCRSFGINKCGIVSFYKGVAYIGFYLKHRDGDQPECIDRTLQCASYAYYVKGGLLRRVVNLD